MSRTNTHLAAALAMVVLVAAACEEEDGGMMGPDGARMYVQIERLGNPLVSEVTFAKRDHGFHNTTGPSTDVANGFRGKVESFVTGVAGRAPAIASTLSSVLIPDMLIVQPTRPGNTSGWLSWALADGYGGRNLSDDVVDAGLMAIFGPLLSSDNVSPGLSSDNVPANDRPFANGFPYLAGGN